MSLRPSAVALLLANCVPLAGVMLLDWRVLDVLLLYWAENVVIGVVNVLRMSVARSKLGIFALAERRSGVSFSAEQRAVLGKHTSRMRIFMIPFFAVHYGMFCWGHYSAVVGLFGREMRESGAGFFSVSLADAWQSPLWIGVAAVAASHLASFYFNFLGQGEYRRTSLAQLMHRPYGRIIALHVAVVAGGFLVTLLGDATWMLLVLIVAKSVIDLRMHERERALLGAADPVG